MKSFVALVVCIGLVSVQGSSIIRQVLSDDHGRDNDREFTTFDDRGAIITKQILNKFRNMETLENDHQKKKQLPPIECENSTCKICDYGFCLTATYKPETDSFDITGRFLGVYTFSTHITVKPWSDCENIDTFFSTFNSCVTIRNVKIIDGKACADVKVSAGKLMEKTFKSFCM